MHKPNRKNWYEFTIKLNLTDEESVVIEALIDKDFNDPAIRVARQIITGVVRVFAYGLRLYNENHLDNWH